LDRHPTQHTNSSNGRRDCDGEAPENKFLAIFVNPIKSFSNPVPEGLIVIGGGKRCGKARRKQLKF
jgi:hypothetical protein